jgi:hypothetical protein
MKNIWQLQYEKKNRAMKVYCSLGKAEPILRRKRFVISCSNLHYMILTEITCDASSIVKYGRYRSFIVMDLTYWDQHSAITFEPHVRWSRRSALKGRSGHVYWALIISFECNSSLTISSWLSWGTDKEGGELDKNSYTQASRGNIRVELPFSLIDLANRIECYSPSTWLHLRGEPSHMFSLYDWCLDM